MRQVELTRGAVALVDDADFDAVTAFRWCLHANGYACRGTWDGARRDIVLMHRFLCDGPLIDHIDGNKLNNQRSNLRVATRGQNAQNQKAQKEGRYKGVYWQANRWLAQICHDRKSVYIGRFADPLEAARAYDTKALELYGAHARLNFPTQGV